MKGVRIEGAVVCGVPPRKIKNDRTESAPTTLMFLQEPLAHHREVPGLARQLTTVNLVERNPVDLGRIAAGVI